MAPIEVSKIIKWTTGRLIQGSAESVVVGISTDTRQIQLGECFIALQGERFDGHAFVADAVSRGAGAVVVSNPNFKQRENVPHDVPVICVEDTTQALADLARGYAGQFDIPVVAVTGSNGKTSTKDMIGSIFQRVFPIVVTEKNYNNEIGLPMTLLKLQAHHRAAVVELGMRALGEIAQLARVAAPSVGVVTNVGPVHLERLGTMDRVADAKAELVEALSEDGLAIINADDEWVRHFSQRTKARSISFGFSEGADARAVNVVTKGLDGSTFDLLFRGEQVPIRLSVPGRHQVLNAAAAAACALSLGVSVQDVQQGLSAFSSGEMRLNVLRLADDVTVINDAYNASPLSVSAALDVLAHTEAKRRVAVLGDMLELGSLSEKAHQQIGKEAVTSGVRYLVAVGRHKDLVVEGALQAGLSKDCIVQFETSEDAARAVGEWVNEGDVILIKGSRGVRLERVAEEIQRRYSIDLQKEAGKS